MTSLLGRAMRSLGGLGAEALRFVLYANLFLALCAALWAYSTYRVLRVVSSSPNHWLLAFIAAGVVVVYTVDRVFTFERYDPETASERHRWIARHRTALLALLGCAVGVTLISLPFLDIRLLALAATAGLLALAYSLPVRKGFTAGLKDFGLLKIFFVAGVWAAVTTVLPILDAGGPLVTRDVALVVAERFLFVFAITLPFDVRDRELDRASNVRTIPVRIGTRKSRVIVATAVAVYLLVKIAHYGLQPSAALVPAAVSAGYIVILLAALTETRHDYYFSLLWDGAILVQAVLALLFAHEGGE